MVVSFSITADASLKFDARVSTYFASFGNVNHMQLLSSSRHVLNSDLFAL